MGQGNGKLKKKGKKKSKHLDDLLQKHHECVLRQTQTWQQTPHQSRPSPTVANSNNRSNTAADDDLLRKHRDPVHSRPLSEPTHRPTPPAAFPRDRPTSVLSACEYADFRRLPSAEQHVRTLFADILEEMMMKVAIKQSIDDQKNQSSSTTPPALKKCNDVASPDEPDLKPLPGFIELTKEPCCVTLDESPVNRARMPCGHVIGLDAVKDMCEFALSHNEFNFKCPSCDAPWEYFLIRHLLSAILTNDEIAHLEMTINDNCMIQSDIQQCPRCGINCFRDRSSYGVKDNQYFVVCQSCYIGTSKLTRTRAAFCWNCKGLWQRKANSDNCGNPGCDPSKWKLRLLETCDTKLIGDVAGCPVVRACPSCGELINHWEHCKHMTCPHCHCQFCFVCICCNQVPGTWLCDPYKATCRIAPRQKSLAQ